MPKADLRPATIRRYHIFLASPGDVEDQPGAAGKLAGARCASDSRTSLLKRENRRIEDEDEDEDEDEPIGPEKRNFQFRVPSPAAPAGKRGGDHVQKSETDSRQSRLDVLGSPSHLSGA